MSTEFLFLQGRPPDEQAQYEHYRAALEMTGGGRLTIRTLDLGADKGSDLLDFKSLRSNPNPALGLRAIRLCLRELGQLGSRRIDEAYAWPRVAQRTAAVYGEIVDSFRSARGRPASTITSDSDGKTRASRSAHVP